MKIIKFLFSALVILLFTSCSKDSEKASADSIDQRVNQLLSQMTLEEKIGQMTQIDISMINKGNDLENFVVLDTAKAIRFIKEFHVGSFLNGIAVSAETWYNFSDQLQRTNMSYSRLKIPIIYGIDHMHGASYLANSTIFPHNINTAATFNKNIPADVGSVTVYESSALGHHWVFSPVLDLGRNKLWPRFYETYGEDLYLAATMGSIYVKAIQNSKDIAPYKVAACAKHFLGYSDPTSGWDRTPAEISGQRLYEFFVPSFQAAIDAGLKTVMINSGEINGVPVHASKEILTTLLRDKLGFKGVAVTDWEDIINLWKGHKVAANEKEATYMAIMAGVDMSMTPMTTNFCTLLKELVNEGRISEERINLSVSRILKLKMELGLFENPYPVNDRFKNIRTNENVAKALNAARESIVLMKNNNKTLPLNANVKTILIVGPNAKSKRALCGGWTLTWIPEKEEMFPEHMQTVFTAMQKEFPGAKIESASAKDLGQKARTANAIVIAAGEMPYSEGVGSISDLELPMDQIELIKIAQSTGKPTILVLIEGRPRTIDKVYDKCDAVLFAGLPGGEGGQAIAEIISGKVNPSAKMSFSYPYKQGHIIPYNHKASSYSFLHSLSDSLKRSTICGFGEGLSYTTFSYSNFTLSDTMLSANNQLTATVTVTNSGERAGKEAVLWFVSDEIASISRPVRLLKSFDKKEFQPGESAEFTFIISPEEHLSFPDEQGNKLLEEGYFEVNVDGLKKRFFYKK